LGNGILDNSKNKAKILYKISEENNDSAVNNAKRMHALSFVCCKNVIIDGITIRDSLMYNINCLSCENITINNIKIIGCWRFNTDGVHFANCKNASLTNSFLRTYDDSICVRGFANYDYDMFLNNEKEEDLLFECSNVCVKNCVVWNDWGKNLQVGTETFSKEVFDIVFEDNKLIHSSGQALTMWIVDNPKVHDVLFKNTLVEYDDYFPMLKYQFSDDYPYIDVYNSDYGGDLVSLNINKHFEYSLIKSEEELGCIDGVKIENLQLYSVQKPVFIFNGDNPNSKCENVTLDGVYWNGEKISQELFEKQTKKNEFTKNIILK
jgi:hypothetical protein